MGWARAKQTFVCRSSGASLRLISCAPTRTHILPAEAHGKRALCSSFLGKEQLLGFSSWRYNAVGSGRSHMTAALRGKSYEGRVYMILTVSEPLRYLFQIFKKISLEIWNLIEKAEKYAIQFGTLGFYKMAD